MSPTEAALIDEYEDKGLREQVRAIAAYDYRGVFTPNGMWYQLCDLHLLSLRNPAARLDREYRDLARTQNT